MTDEDKQCPLAHDSHGEPLVLPDTAAFWRVRRGQAGVRGRPPYAYGKNGAPVVLPIDADADALRAAGLPPGSYRLEALDAEYHVLAGILAYTELDLDGEETDDPDEGAAGPRPSRGGGEPRSAMRALSKVIESMQRSQAEREKAQAEVYSALAKRIGASAHEPAEQRQLMRNAVVEVLRDERAQQPAPVVSAAPPPEPEAEGAKGKINWDAAAKFAEPYAPFVMQMAMGLMAKFGINLGAVPQPPPPEQPAAGPAEPSASTSEAGAGAS